MFFKAAMGYQLDSLDSSKNTSKNSPEVALALLTCAAYVPTRLRALLHAWGSVLPMRMVGSDQPHVPGFTAANTIVVPDVISTNASEKLVVGDKVTLLPAPYIPPWRRAPSTAADEDEPIRSRADFLGLPALAPRLLRTLERLYDKFHKRADWYLISDDDTFVRVHMLTASLSLLDADKMLMVGTPIDSSRFLSAAELARHGQSAHCAGGAGWVLSRAAMGAFRLHIHRCLSLVELAMPAAEARYYNDVLVGRCLHVMLGLSCSAPFGSWGAGFDFFQGGLYSPSDWATYTHATQKTAWIGTITFHAALPDDMARLRMQFRNDANHTNLWLQGLQRNAGNTSHSTRRRR